MKRIRQTIDNETDVDMTPMLDVVFILLIFFIVTTSFIKESAIDIHRPQKSAPPTDIESKNVVIKLTKLNQVLFNNRKILRTAIRSNIEVFLSQHPKAQVLLQAAKTANTGILVNIVDQAKLAGIQQVTVGQLAENNQ